MTRLIREKQFKETESEKLRGEQADQETTLSNNRFSEFLARRAFWFFFAVKKNTNSLAKP